MRSELAGIVSKGNHAFEGLSIEGMISTINLEIAETNADGSGLLNRREYRCIRQIHAMHSIPV